MVYNYAEDEVFVFINEHCAQEEEIQKYPTDLLINRKGQRMDQSEKAYHEQYQRSYMWSNVEQLHALQNTNCFFIGLSMTDPNLRRLLDFAKNEANSKGQRDIQNYAFLSRKSFTKDIDATKATIFLEKQEDMLHDLGVRVIWYKDHTDLPDLLANLQQP